jgi:hypothetical protein
MKTGIDSNELGCDKHFLGGIKNFVVESRHSTKEKK